MRCLGLDAAPRGLLWTPREVEHEAARPHAPVPVEVFSNGVYHPVHKEEVCGPGGGAVWVEASGVQPVGAVLELVLVYISNA